MERQIKIEGTLAPCECGRQPKHYLRVGRSLHFLECSPCAARTASYPTFQQAVESWERHETTAVGVRR